MHRALLLIIALLGPSVLAADAPPDASSPKSAARAFFKAMQSGDVAAAKALAAGSDKQLAMLDVIAPVVAGFKQLEVAATAKWGDAGRAAFTQGAGKAGGFNFSDDLATAQEAVAGDTATLTTASRPNDPIRFKKVDNAWRIDLANIRTEVLDQPEALGRLKAMTVAAKSTADEIGQDKYKTPDEARAALAAKLRSAK